MKVFTIADLHLALGVPGKSMDPFGPIWKDHPKRLEEKWQEMIKEEDLVLIPGDISWAKRIEDAMVDLAWINHLPGQKVLLQGNHDYWWSSLKKLQTLPFKTLHYLQNNALRFGDLIIGGTRLWDTDEYSFPLEKLTFSGVSMKEKADDSAEREKIFTRELHRLQESIKQMEKEGEGKKVILTHYPPIGKDLRETRASKLIQASGATLCLFGHLHNFPPGSLSFGEADGVNYKLVSFDYLEGVPLEVFI